MKNFLFLSILLSVYLGVYGQNFSIFGSGTTVNGTTTSSPVNNYFRRNVCQFVYTVAEINAAGVPAGASISQIGWFVTQNANQVKPGYTVKMKHVTQTNVSTSLGTTGWTTVINSFTYPTNWTTNNWQMMSFNTAFVWDGVSNIGVEVCWSQTASWTSTGQCRIYSTTSGYRHSWTDAAGTSCGLDPLTVNTNKPQARIAWTPNSCSGTPNAGTLDLSSTSGCNPGNPLVLDATNISTGTGISYQWQSGSSSTGPWNNISGATTVPFTTVEPSSTTYYRLITTCSNSGSSNNSNVQSFSIISSPTATGATVNCGDPATLSASGSTGNYIWYDDTNGTNQVGNGNSFTTPNLSQNTTYYVAATSGSGSGTTSQLATTQVGGNGCGGGNMFDITTNTALNLTGFTVTPTSNGTQNVVIFYKSGTYVGSQTNQGAWTNAGTYSINGTAGTPILVNLNTPISLSGNSTYGIYVQYNAQYTTGANTYSNADMTITAGMGHCSPFDGCCTPRTFNGIVHYQVGTSGCLSPLVPVTVNVNGPAAPSVNDDYVNIGDPATLTASGAPSGGDYLWFDDANGTNQVGNGPSFTTPNLSTNTTYYVGVVSAGSSTSSTNTIGIIQSNLLNVASSCGTNSWYGGSNQGFSWVDNTPTGVTVSSISIQISVGVECNPQTRTVILNGITQGTFSTISHCNCNGSNNAIVSINVNPSNYNLGSTNTVSISGGGTFGFFGSPTLSNNYARLTINYTQGSQGCLSSLVPVTGFIVSQLPVTLTSFTSSCNNGMPVLSWTTESEQNSHYFQIERSGDGDNWVIVGSVKAAGNSNQNINYEFIDNTTFNGYYRLKQVDFDGRFEYFGPISSNCEINNFKISPNPTNNIFIISGKINNELTIFIKDNTGKILYSEQLSTNESLINKPIDISDLSPGHYIVIINGKPFNIIKL